MNRRYTRRRMKGGGKLTDYLVSLMLKLRKEQKAQKFQENEQANATRKQANRERSLLEHRRAIENVPNVGSFFKPYENIAEANNARRINEREQREREQRIIARNEVIIKQISDRLRILENAYSKIADIHINRNTTSNSQLLYITEKLEGVELFDANPILAEIRTLRDQLSPDYKRAVNLVIGQLEGNIRTIKDKYKDLYAEKERLEYEKKTKEASEKQRLQLEKKEEERARKRAEAEAQKRAEAEAEKARKKAEAEEARRKAEEARREKIREQRRIAKTEDEGKRNTAKANALRFLVEKEAEAEEARRKAEAEAEEARREKIREQRRIAKTEDDDKRNVAKANALQFLSEKNAEVNKMRQNANVAKNAEEKAMINSLTVAEESHAKGAFINRFPNLQSEFLKLLNIIYNALYIDEASRADIFTNVSEETKARATSVDAIKKNLYRFFIKGGAARTLLYSKKEDNKYPFTNDIDVVLLINPSLNDADFQNLHKNITEKIIQYVSNFIVKEYSLDVLNIVPANIPPQIIVPDDIKNYNDKLKELSIKLNANPFAYVTQNITFNKYQQQLVNIKADIDQKQLEINILKPIVEPTIDTFKMQFGQQISKLFFVQTKTSIDSQIHQLQSATQMGFPLQFAQQLNILNAQKNIIDTILNFYNKIDEIKQLRYQKQQLETMQINPYIDNATRVFNYKLFFNQAYRNNDGNLVYLNQTSISIVPRMYDGKYELFDFLLPYKNYKYINEEWNYYTSRKIDDLQLNVQGPVSIYIDQDRTVAATPISQPGKLDQRSKRLKFLNAQVRQAIRKNNANVHRNIETIQNHMNQPTFRRLFPYVGGSTRKLPRWFKARKN